jgi:hypothetical protein
MTAPSQDPSFRLINAAVLFSALAVCATTFTSRQLDGQEQPVNLAPSSIEEAVRHEVRS